MANIAYTRASVKPAGITTWRVQTAGSAGWATFSYLRNAKVTFTTVSNPDSKGINRPHATKMVATAELMTTSSLTGIVEVLDTMASSETDSQLVLRDGQVIATSLIPVVTGKAGAGFSWKFVSDGDLDKNRFIEIRAERTMLLSEVDTAFGGSDTEGTGVANSGFSAWSAGISDIVPAGIEKIEFGAGSYTDDLGIFRNAKFSEESVFKMDQFGRNIPYLIKIDFSAEMLQASSTERALLDQSAGLDIDWKLTFADGRVCTLDSTCGIDYEFSSLADADDTSFIKLTGTGTTLITNHDGLWT